MNLRFRIITALLIVLAIGVAAWRFMPKPKAGSERAYFLGVDGDPRMRVCNSPKDAENATPDALKALKLDAPLVANANDKANYRASVFFATGKAISIEFATPIKGPAGYAKIGVFENDNVKFETRDLTFEQSKDILDKLIAANIWGPLQKTFEPIKIKTPATAIIEIQAPNQKRCVATRYDDERVRGILGVLEYRVSSVLKEIDIAGFSPPKEKILGKEVGGN